MTCSSHRQMTILAGLSVHREKLTSGAQARPIIWEMERRPTQKEKTQRAFRVYLDLLDTAEWLRGYMRGPLESFDLTMGGFRLLELLYREGALTVTMAAEKRGCRRQNIDVLVAQLEERGWVRRMIVTLPPVEFEESHLPKAERGKRREGRRVAVLGLSRLGKKFIGNLLPKHGKLVKALTRVLDGREQESLSRLCRKLREGDVVKFYSEITHEDQEE
jgi:DNA-binding MarR family transcriptional regulator